MEFMYGVRFHISGDPIVPHKGAIILMNHRTRLDWMFLWSALYKMQPRWVMFFGIEFNGEDDRFAETAKLERSKKPDSWKTARKNRIRGKPQ